MAKNYPYIDSLVTRYPALAAIQKELILAVDALISCYGADGKMLICGNGGSCADADHLVGELMKGYLKTRPLSQELQRSIRSSAGREGSSLASSLQQSLPAINLAAHMSFVTAFSNDVAADYVFAQQVLGYGRKGDVLLGISTSGNAKNVLFAAVVANARGLTTIGLTGKEGGKLRKLCSVCICVPSSSTPYIQELHLPAYHAICAEVESHFFPDD
jgi:D-sedoheptulose 7-phosphate isomerase